MTGSQSRKRSRISWSDLPTDVVQVILELLIFKLDDVQNFRAVCENWRRSTQISAYLPHHIKSSVPTKLISSSISLLHHPHTSQLYPWMVLAVEPTKGITQLFNPFSRTPLLSTNLPDLTQFRSTLLATQYHVVADEQYDNLFSCESCIYGKVVLFLNRYVPSIRNCDLLALSDGGRIFKSLPFNQCQSFRPAHKGHNGDIEVDDIIRYRGKNYALDRKGKLYSYGKHGCGGFHFCEQLMGCPLFNATARRKRLVVMVSPSGGDKLFLVLPVNGLGRGPTGEINLHFRVYELKSMHNRHSSWVLKEVTSFGDADWVMFVTRDYCFFVAAAEFSGCQLRNCIVFSEDAFPEYNVSKSGWDSGNQGENKVAVFSLDVRVYYSLPVEYYPGFPVMLWSPPPWILQNASSTLQSEPLSELEENEMIQSDSDDEDSVSLQEEVSLASSGPEREEQTTEIPSSNAALAVTTRSSPVMNDMEHVAEEVLETESLSNVIVPIDSMAHLAQPSVKKVVTFKFRGIDVESEHLPVLQKVWMKHGDVVEGSAIHSCDAIAMALSSLAKMVLVLQTSGDTLTDDQAHYLGSTLSDLQYMRLKVDWLTPFVEKVLVMHKSKQLQASLVELKAKAEEMEQKFLSDMAEMKQRLDKNIKLVSESMEVDHSKCLGDGLF